MGGLVKRLGKHSSANRHHLHAQRLSLSHPVTKEKLTFEVKEYV